MSFHARASYAEDTAGYHHSWESPAFSVICPFRSSEKVVVAAAGFEADISTLKKVVQWRNVVYSQNHKKPMSVTAAAQLIGNTLYYKRFFPYYSFTIVAGLDSEGEQHFWAGAAIQCCHTLQQRSSVPWFD